MSSMGELTFFLGLQVQQKKDGIFISQDKYVADILKKFDFATMKITSTPIEPNKALIKDEEADSMDVHLYRSMIGSLLYLIASKLDIMFVVCACARFQVTPKMSHLHAVKRIFRYLKGQPKLGLWYPKDSPFDLEAFPDSDYVGASLTRNHIEVVNFLARDLKFVDQHNMVACLEKTEENAEFHQIVDFLTTCSINYALTVVVISESSVRSNLLFNDKDGIACLTNDEIFENLALMGYEQLSTKLTFQKDISTTNIPVTIAGAEISTTSPEDKIAKISGDSDDNTLAETLIEIKISAIKPQKVKGVAFRNVEESPRLITSTTTLQPLPTIDIKDKGKGVLVKELVKVKRRDQRWTELKKKDNKKEATIAVLTEEFDEIQARVDDDYELAARLTYEEQEYQQQIESKKKRQREDSDKEISKKQKLEEDNDAEKEELRAILDIVPKDDIAINIKSLATKYPIVD
ncbi:uncharacterized mitochondrial protein-like protein [Tanacetum coccineum]